MLDGLRAVLNEVGLTPFDIQLPDEDPAVAPLEGALQVRALGGRFVLETVDYGQAFRLLDAGSEREIKEAVIGYVSRPLPPVRAMARQELDTLLRRVAAHYGNLLNDLRAAGPPGFVIDLPPQLPLDRIGALDGVHTYPIGTPFEHRSLPPTALRPENDGHKFLTTAAVRVRAAITPPWFGRPAAGSGSPSSSRRPACGTWWSPASCSGSTSPAELEARSPTHDLRGSQVSSVVGRVGGLRPRLHLAGRPSRPPAAVLHMVRAARRAAGLLRIRLHDVRHSYASAALAAGIPAKVVSERLGHGSRAGQSGQGQRAGKPEGFKAGGFLNKKAADAWWKDDEAELRGGTWLDLGPARSRCPSTSSASTPARSSRAARPRPCATTARPPS